ncbi:unnamed protein product [Hanseniaspora opuntiae]
MLNLVKDIKLKELKLIVNCMPKYFHKQTIKYQNINNSDGSVFHLEGLSASDLKSYKRLSILLDNNKNLTDFIKQNDFKDSSFKKLSFHANNQGFRINGDDCVLESNNDALFINDKDVILFIILNLIKEKLSSKDEISYETINKFMNIFKEAYETVLVWSLLTGDFDRIAFETTEEWKKSLIKLLPLNDVLVVDEKCFNLKTYIDLL